MTGGERRVCAFDYRGIAAAAPGNGRGNAGQPGQQLSGHQRGGDRAAGQHGAADAAPAGCRAGSTEREGRVIRYELADSPVTTPLAGV